MKKKILSSILAIVLSCGSISSLSYAQGESSVIIENEQNQETPLEKEEVLSLIHILLEDTTADTVIVTVPVEKYGTKVFTIPSNNIVLEKVAGWIEADCCCTGKY